MIGKERDDLNEKEQMIVQPPAAGPVKFFHPATEPRSTQGRRVVGLVLNQQAVQSAVVAESRRWSDHQDSNRGGNRTHRLDRNETNAALSQCHLGRSEPDGATPRYTINVEAATDRNKRLKKPYFALEQQERSVCVAREVSGRRKIRCSNWSWRTVAKWWKSAKRQAVQTD